MAQARKRATQRASTDADERVTGDPFVDEAAAWGDDDDETGWRPEVGALVVGRIESIDVRSTTYGPAPVIVVRADSHGGNRIAVWGLHTVLRNALKRAKPQPGERIAVKRLTDGENENGSFQRYRVAVDRKAGSDAAAFDWNAQKDGKSRTPQKRATDASWIDEGDDDDDDKLPF